MSKHVVGNGKRGLWEKGSFQSHTNVHCLDILKTSEILEIPESHHSVENKGESDHFLERPENLEMLETPKILPARRPLL